MPGDLGLAMWYQIAVSLLTLALVFALPEADPRRLAEVSDLPPAAA